MATKREEQIAWKKLKAAFPKKYCSFDLEMVQHCTDTADTVRYRAYVDTEVGNFLGKYSPSPMEAVDDLIQKAKET
jgi:hypothetical protein